MNKTVFVIGAGASQELNLPTGYGLKNRIATLLSFGDRNTRGECHADRVIEEILDRKNNESYYKACEQICRAMPQAISIDNFLYDRGDDEFIVSCGKLAIARAILHAESESKMLLSPGLDYPAFRALENTWLTPFFQRIRENCRPHNLKERFSGISLIIFNYDRCVEYYLYWALQNYYKISPEEAASLINDMDIYHPYGSVGFLPWQKFSSEISIQYGEEPSGKDLETLSGNIKTFTEQIDDSNEELKSLRSDLMRATKIVFLGFGYHPLNKELLFPSSAIHGNSNELCRKTEVQIYGTAYDIPLDDYFQIKKYFADLFSIVPANIKLEDLECYNLFKNYHRGLSFI